MAGLAAALLWPTRHRRRRRAAATPPRPPAPVVFLGDSITSGHGLPLEEAFPHRIGAALGIPVQNAGVSGDQTEGGLARLDAEVLALHPRLVVVELGVNDVFDHKPRERTVANLREITRRIRRSGARVVLIHLRLPSTVRLSSIVGDGYRADLREIARSEGATLVEDFLDDVVPRFSPDGLHPDADGHARLAERLAPILRPLVER